MKYLLFAIPFVINLTIFAEETDYRFMKRGNNNIHAAELIHQSSSATGRSGIRVDINSRTDRRADYLLNDNYYVLGIGKADNDDLLLKVKIDQPLNLNPFESGNTPIYFQFDAEFGPAESNAKGGLLIRTDLNEYDEYQTQYLISYGKLRKESADGDINYLNDENEEWLKEVGKASMFSDYIEVGAERAMRLSRDTTAMFGIGVEYHDNVTLVTFDEEGEKIGDEDIDGGVRFNLKGGIEFAVHPSVIVGVEAQYTHDRFGEETKKFKVEDILKSDNLTYGVSAKVAL